VKIWSFVWKFDFHWIFMWNMLNVWKYDHLCENLTFIWYLCENMAISEVCAVSEVLCLVSDGHYTESGNCSISDEEKGRHALGTHVSHLSKGRCANETRVSHLNKWRCTLWRHVSPLLYMQKKNTYKLFSTGFSLHQHAEWPLAHIRSCMSANGHSTGSAQEAPRGAQVVWHLRST
jgi:hypothetical protein